MIARHSQHLLARAGHRSLPATVALLLAGVNYCASAQDEALRQQALDAMRKAATYYRQQVASHGGYVYFYTLDLSQRWGEGLASPDQIWVQPPATPTVGLAYLKAYEATGEAEYREAATAAAEALVYGQLASGGWTHAIDFDPGGTRVAQYRNGKGRGKNYSSLDDGQTQSALRLLIHVDHALEFRHRGLHEATQFALDSLLAAQFPNGAFPQVWTGPVVEQPVRRASFPDDDWRREGRVKNYWDMYTLNDNVAGYVAETLIDAAEKLRDDRCLAALRRLGDFLLLAQLPEPQPGWAQQYNYDMKPIWARKFEPPAVAGDESQEVIHTLLRIYQATGDRRYLEPVPRALAWLKRSRLPDGRLARFYELQTNRPLYMIRRGGRYQLTYDDQNLPSHYGWKIEAKLDSLERQFAELQSAPVPPRPAGPTRPSPSQVRRILEELDEQGRWVERYRGERLVGQPKMPLGTPYLSSEVFSRNLTLLSDYVAR